MERLKIKSKKLIEVDYGLASVYDEGIEINRKLNLNPKLRDSIIKHEERHDHGKYTFKDFKNDFMAKNSNFFESLMFSFQHKECLVGFFPFMYSYYFKEWTYNSSALWPVIYLGILFVGFFKLTTGLPFLHLILGFLAFMAAMNLITLLVAHNYVKKVELKREKEHFKDVFSSND